MIQTTPVVNEPRKKNKEAKSGKKVSEISTMYYYASPQLTIYQVPLLEFSSLFLEIMIRYFIIVSKETFEAEYYRDTEAFLTIGEGRMVSDF